MKTVIQNCDFCGDQVESLFTVALQGRIRDACDPCLEGLKHFTEDRDSWIPHKEAAVKRIADEFARIQAEDAQRAVFVETVEAKPVV